MSLPATGIREKIARLSRKTRYLLFSSISLGFLIILIVSGIVIHYFYFGYHREKFVPKGTEIQGWYQGKKIDAIAGKVVRNENSLITIENEGMERTIRIVGKVFYCEKNEEMDTDESRSCGLIDQSQIQPGMYLTVDRKGGEIKEAESYSLESGAFIVVAD